ncbi:AEC family transporter [Paenibacillus sp. y28]|uniref:AEC family transporter n=1 Tax=Paenibacillus sp. y28 TaxID=3129110 RepID=UPI0030163758
MMIRITFIERTEGRIAMGSYVSLFGQVSAPILLACLLGFLYQHYKKPDARTMADVSLFVLSPCLIVSALAESELQGSIFLDILVFTLIQTALCWAASAGIGRLFRFDLASRRAMDLTTLFANSNNYGLPLLLLAFGTTGLAIGVTNVVLHIVLVNTLGMYLASRTAFQPKQAIRQIAKTPLLYASIAGVIIFVLQIRLPSDLMEGLKLVGSAYPALVLLILGMQLRKTNWRHSWRKEIWISLGLRIVIVPLLSWITIRLIGLHGLTASVLFVQSSMPSAINSVMLMEKYGATKIWWPSTSR